MRVGLLQYKVGRYPGFQAWEAAFDARIAEAAGRGVDLALLPEYASLDAIPAPLRGFAAERDASCDQHDAVLAAMHRAARQHSVWLLGGSLLCRRPDGTLTNHAPLITPNGLVAFQEKHRPTPFEREHWQVCEGEPPAVFDTPWGRLGVAVCYDIEHPPLARAQVEAGAWLVLVPTATDTLAGFNRVRLAARACALSNQCYVAVSTTVGDAPWLTSLDTNHGYAAVFGPVDTGFPDDGVIARGGMDEAGWLCVDLDPAPLAEIREHGAVRNHRDYPVAPPACPILTLCP